jgi:hypothetical protein
LSHEKATMGEKIKDNNEKIENNRHVYTFSLMKCKANFTVGNYRTSLAT